MNKFKIAGAIIGLFIVLIVFIPTRHLVEIFNGVFFGTVFAVTVTYFPLTKRSLFKKEIDVITLMTFAIVCVWTATIISRVLSVWWRVSGDFSIVNSVLSAGAVYLSILAGILFIAAPGMQAGHFVHNRRLLINSAVAGGLIALVVIWAQAMTDEITNNYARQTEPAVVVEDVAEAIFSVTGNWLTATMTQREMARTQAVAAITAYKQGKSRGDMLSDPCGSVIPDPMDLFRDFTRSRE